MMSFKREDEKTLVDDELSKERAKRGRRECLPFVVTLDLGLQILSNDIFCCCHKLYIIV